MKRKGISLITLIITIIVVIILAAAVILSLGNQNPVNSSKLASLLKSKETMEECLKIVVADKIADTLGQTTVKAVITETPGSEIVAGQETKQTVTKDGATFDIWEVSAIDYKNNYNLELSNTPNKNSKWYVDEKGRMFLVYDFIENVPEFMKDDETTLNKSVEPFVIVTGEELKESIEESIKENTQITLPEGEVDINEKPEITVDTSNVEKFEEIRWEIKDASGNIYNSNNSTSNNTKISLDSITEPGEYYLNVIIKANNTEVKMSPSKLVVVKKPDVWTGDTATSFAGGTGTVEDPYIIETAAQLAYFRDQVTKGKDQYTGKVVKMVNNIDLQNQEWTSIGTTSWSNMFRGTFDGDNNSISNIKITEGQGFFYELGEGATIKNLTLASGSVTSEYGEVGGLCSRINSDNVKIENCINKLNVTGWTEVGGIIGSASKYVEIIDCKNYGNIIATNAHYSAGICGRANGGANIVNCHNYGEISLDNGNSYAGGIISYVNAESNIEKCSNSGKVEGKSYIAGILGYVETSQQVTITECVNTGDITGENYLSGIVAYMKYNGTNISYCYNTGAITSTKNDSNISGICSSGGSDKVYNITNCYNTGLITTTSAYRGAIYAAKAHVSKNCYYLQDSCDKPIAGYTDIEGEAEVKSENDFKKKSGETGAVVDLLNTGLETGSEKFVVVDGYPVLKWQISSNN